MKNSLLVFLLLFAAMRGYGQCTLSVSLTSSGPAICSGSSVVLTATASAGTAPYSYAWSDGETTSSISVNKPGIYSVTVSDKTPGCQPVKQSITIGTGTVPAAPTVKNVVACPNSSVTLTASAPGGTYQWYDASTGGNFLATGASYTTPPITANTVFYVQTTLNGCTSPRSAATVTLQAAPGVANTTVCSGDVATLQASGGVSYAWYANSGGTGTVLGTGSSFVTPPLTTTTTYYVVVTASNGCLSAPVPVVAFVTATPTAPTATGTTICSGSVVTLHATGTGVIDWFTTPSGGTSLISSPDFTTPPLTATTTYYIQSTVNTCVSTRTPVTVIVNPIPSAPIISGVTTCYGTSATLTPTSPGGTYQWYNAQTGGVLLFTGPSFTTPALTNTTTYYVRVNNGCISALTPVTVTVTPAPASPSASGQVICSGSTATLTATAPGGIYEWYNASTGGALLFTGAAFTTQALTANTTYYVQTTVAGCVSARTPVTVSIMPPPASPIAPGVSTCSGSTATLNVTSPSGNYAWYDATTGGTLLAAGPIFITPVLTTNTTYYVEAINATGCPSVRTPVTVTISTSPAPSATGTTVCPGSVATLTATGTGTISWYDAATGGNLLFTGTTYTTPALSTTTTYYVQQTITCPSPRTAVSVNVTSVAFPQFKYSSGTYCTNSPNPAPAVNNPSGGTFSATPAGLVFVSATTGQINIGASAPGTYNVTFNGNGTCPTLTTVKITITSTPNAQFAYNATAQYCQSQNITATPVFQAGASTGVFAGSPSGLDLNPATGQFNPSLSTPGTYTVTNSIPASGTCAATSASVTVVIDQAITVNAGSNQVVAASTPVNLSGTVTGPVTTGTWSGGTGSFSNPNSLNTVYTPGAGEASATLTLTSATPSGPCGPQSSTVTITFSPPPSGPVAAGTTVCPGSVATLTATAPGGTYRWYDAATGGTLLSTGPTFVTPPITVNTTYYVSTTVVGATSTRTAVPVTLNATPPPPVAASTSTCSGSSVTLTATGSAGGYEWYDSPTGGNLLSTNASYTTTFLTTPASYYVQSVVNGCVSTRAKVDVNITPVPNVTSSPAGNICGGTAQNYVITADVTGATFTWSRAAVTNISNPAITGQTSSTITETLINTGASPVNVTYIITPAATGCAGSPFSYVVTVSPAPAVSSASSLTVCNGSAIGYNITFISPAGVTFSWSRASVAGISNAPISGQASGTIEESLFNTTNAPVDVIYVIAYQTATCTGLTFNLTVTVNPPAVVTSAKTGSACTGVPQNYTITSNVTNATFTWSRATVAGISNGPVSNQMGSTITETLINTTSNPVNVLYNITPTSGSCAGTPFQYNVSVNSAVPTPVVYTNTPICTGNAINLQSPTIPNATYNWSGPNGFTSAQQNPVIQNVTTANAGTYSLFITINGCVSTTVTASVVVDPPPMVSAGPDQVVCANTTSVQLVGSVTGGTTTGIWTTSGTGTFPAGITVLNGTYSPSVGDQNSGKVTLTLTSTSPDNCNPGTSTMTITFSAPAVTSAKTGSVCSGTAQNYTITSDFPTATFTWSRAAVAGISNPAVSGQTSSSITETLNNTTASPVPVDYIITPVSNGCPGNPFTYTVTINAIPVAPTATSNSPVCVGKDVTLQVPSIPGATYSWTGPNGFTSAQQNPTISSVTAANAGAYNVTVTVNGCTGPPSADVNVQVDPQSTAHAGSDQTICPAVKSISLSGTITGGPASGLWTTTGNGTIGDPNNLQTAYAVTAQDIANGSVTFTLATVSNDNCSISTSQMTIKIQLLSTVTAGPDQSICSQGGAKLAGQITIPGGGVWTSSGTGTFKPNASQLDATYEPSAADQKSGSVVLTLTANNPGNCYIPSDKLTVTLVPPPTVSIAGPVYVLKGQTATLAPTVSDPDVQYSWSPNIDIDNTTAQNPVITGGVDRTYTLTITDARGCTSTAKVDVVVSPLITIPNTFTPNGDGVNDYWTITGLTAYTHATVDIFDRNGQKVFHSVGYGVPWDGTYTGKQVPYGVYYYIIDPKFDGLKVMTGYVTVIR